MPIDPDAKCADCIFHDPILEAEDVHPEAWASPVDLGRCRGQVPMINAHFSPKHITFAEWPLTRTDHDWCIQFEKIPSPP